MLGISSISQKLLSCTDSRFASQQAGFLPGHSLPGSQPEPLRRSRLRHWQTEIGAAGPSLTRLPMSGTLPSKAIHLDNGKKSKHKHWIALKSSVEIKEMRGFLHYDPDCFVFALLTGP